jgi:hypothetical protein
VNTLYILFRRMEGQTDNFTPWGQISPLGDNCHSWGITSPLGDNFAPGGSKFAPSGEVKNGPQSEEEDVLLTSLKELGDLVLLLSRTVCGYLTNCSSYSEY